MIDSPTRGSFGILAICLILIFSGCKDAPLVQARATWSEMKKAERIGAARSVPELADAAQACYDSAWQVIDRENDRWPIMRHFGPAERLFSRAAQLADSAARYGVTAAAKRKRELEDKVQCLRAELAGQQLSSGRELGSLALRKALTVAELKLAVAASNLESSSDQTLTTIAHAENAIETVNALLDEERSLAESDKSISEYWLTETVKWSMATGCAALIVVKRGHHAYLLKRGRVDGAFQVDLGYNSSFRKLHSGDAATPEGIYRIVKKRETGSSFYKSLELDYPNAEDLRRFNLAQQSGRIPYGTGAGDGIAVHGDGGVGWDWTDGCVALSNQDMDRLMQSLNIGDRVAIVRYVDGLLP